MHQTLKDFGASTGVGWSISSIWSILSSAWAGAPTGAVFPRCRPIDEIDDADEIDQPRTEGPWMSVRREKGSPLDAPNAERLRCVYRRRVVDFVDLVEFVGGGLRHWARTSTTFGVCRASPELFAGIALRSFPHRFSALGAQWGIVG